MTTDAVTLTPSVDADATRAIRAWLVPVLVGAAVFMAASLVVDSYVVGVVHDDGMYVVLAKALASGRGYRWLHLPGAPPATHFPPGYPAVLALLWKLFPSFPENVAAFEFANVLFLSAAAIGAFYFARLRFGMSELGSAILALATTLGIPTLALTVLVMSEPLFLALLVPTLLYAERIVSGESPRTRDIVVLALLVGAATLVRTHGIALIGAITIVLALRRRWRDAALFAGIAGATLVPWQLWVATHAGVVPSTMSGNYESYGAWFAGGLRAEGVDLIGRTLLRTTSDLGGMFETLLAPSMPTAVRITGLTVLCSLGILGARTLWRRTPVSAGFLALYSAIILVWPFWPARFFWGVWPLVMMLPILGMRDVLAWRPSSRPALAARTAALTAGALLAVGYLSYNARGYRHRWWGSIPRSISGEVRPMLNWIASHAPRNALLATEAETSVYLYTGRAAVPVTTFTVDEYFRPRSPVENAAVIDTILTRYRPTAVIVSSGNMRDAVRELAFHQPPRLVAVDTFPLGGLVLVPRLR